MIQTIWMYMFSPEVPDVDQGLVELPAAGQLENEVDSLVVVEERQPGTRYVHSTRRRSNMLALSRSIFHVFHIVREQRRHQHTQPQLLVVYTNMSVNVNIVSLFILIPKLSLYLQTKC